MEINQETLMALFGGVFALLWAVGKAKGYITNKTEGTIKEIVSNVERGMAGKPGEDKLLVAAKTAIEDLNLSIKNEEELQDLLLKIERALDEERVRKIDLNDLLYKIK